MIQTDHRALSAPGPDAHPGEIPELARILTADPHFQQILLQIPTFARSELPVLMVGEPGTGKELIAEAIWALSPRHQNRLYRINCAALTESLAGSELFGHLRGSFTDARYTRPGKFKLAHKATLFLDEVGDLPMSIQPRLLRAVEQGEIEPVGTDASIRVDVRLLAASNQNLPQRIDQGRFRQDLYDRLGVLLINLPPLRERPSDILLLARHVVAKKARRYRDGPVQFSRMAERLLLEHSWPGNVRELKNVLTRAVLLSSGPFIREKDLTFIRPRPPKGPTLLVPLASRPNRERLEELLKEEGGNITALSRRLRVCTKTLYRWLRFHHIDLLHIRAEAEI